MKKILIIIVIICLTCVGLSFCEEGFSAASEWVRRAESDLDMDGYRVNNSSTIEYSPTSKTLINAEYYKNCLPKVSVTRGTTTVQTTSSGFVDLGLENNMIFNDAGIHIHYLRLYAETSQANKTVTFDLIQSTSSLFDVNINTITSVNVICESANTRYDRFVGVFELFDASRIGITYYYKIMWKTTGGTATNQQYNSEPARSLIHKWYPNQLDMDFED